MSIWRSKCLCEHCADTFQTVACKFFQGFAQWGFPNFDLTKITWGICHCSTAKLIGRERASQRCISLCSYLLIRDRVFTCLCSLDIYTMTSCSPLHQWRPLPYLEGICTTSGCPKGKEQKEIIVHKIVYAVNMLKDRLLILPLYNIAYCAWNI